MTPITKHWKSIAAVALLTIALVVGIVYAQTPVQQSATDTTAATIIGNAHTTGAAVTFTPPAGQSVYITGLDVSNCAQASAVTAAADTTITTSGFAGTWTIYVGSGVTAGLCQPQMFAFSKPIKGLQGTAAVFTLPTFATNQVIGLNVYAYYAP